jgi:hypothetical protein
LDTGSLLLILSIIIVVGLVVSRPFFSDSLPKNSGKLLDDEMTGDELAVSDLAAEKDHAFTAIQELDTDYSLGKIPEEEYNIQREVYKAAAAQILRRIDDLDKQILAAEAVGTKPANLPETVSLPYDKIDSIEEMIAARRQSRNEKSAGFCPRCGKVIRKSDQFCPACGLKVSV